MRLPKLGSLPGTALLALLAVGVGSSAHGQQGSGLVVLDPSGVSRQVIVVVSGKAYTLQTVPIVDGVPAPPNGDEPPPVDVPDTLGFVAVASAAADAAGLSADERESLAKAYDEAATLANQYGTLNEYANAANAIVAAAGEISRNRPIFDAVHEHLKPAWGTKVNTQDLLATSYREVAAGLRKGAAK